VQLGAHLVFLDESGFLLIPNLKRTWAPQGQTPYCPMWYKQGRVNAFNAVAVSPKHYHLALYVQFHQRTLRGEEVVGFLKPLLRHLRGPVLLLWDRGPIHRRRLVQDFLRRYPRVHAEYFPAYAPELNPAEYVWTRADAALANGTPRNEQELTRRLRSSMRKLNASQSLLWSCIYASDLPWTR
jgi:transposase